MPDLQQKILEGLNPQQAEAARIIDGPLLILAGAGSGKTKTLTHRIAHLMASGVAGRNILAVTFTNKAAGEMKERIARLLHAQGFDTLTGGLPQMGTFHSVCVRMLRQHIDLLGYNRDFVIYDSSDQEQLIKSCLEDLSLDPKRFKPRSMLGRISELKSELISADQSQKEAKDFSSKNVASVYDLYQQKLKASNAVDFDDLLMLTVRLLQLRPEVLGAYQNQFKYLLIDEYQDTNHAQYIWAKLLATSHRNIAVVGDDAQSIYGWRRADIRNILDFEKDYPEAKVVTLEENYRSTQTILTAANHIILNNSQQKTKNLWTKNDLGAKITIKEAHTDREEGEYIIDVIKKAKPGERAGFTVLYRTHAQSRAMEEALIKHGVPYKILGGIKFYERREVKDVLAYLRLARNPSDQISFKRIFNTPARGLGLTTLKKIQTADLTATNLAGGIASLDLADRQTKTLMNFAEKLEKFRQSSHTLAPTKLIKVILKELDFEEYLRDKTQEGEERWENVQELFTATKKYDDMPAPESTDRFLEEVALIQDTDPSPIGGGEFADQPAVTLMTLHSAKGLEFPYVFIIGMEEGIFPHSRSLFNPSELEEERRLCYVGVTRAKKELHLLYCRQRNLYGNLQINPPSRFISEIPEELVSFKRSGPGLGLGAFGGHSSRRRGLVDWDSFEKEGIIRYD